MLDSIRGGLGIRNGIATEFTLHDAGFYTGQVEPHGQLIYGFTLHDAGFYTSILCGFMLIILVFTLHDAGFYTKCRWR